MGYPSSSDYPGALDSSESRTDNVDIIWANDFDYQDMQIRRLQEFLGETGKMIGENIAGSGLAGMISAVADGNTAFTLAARNDFTSGTLLSIEDDYDGTPQQLARLNYAGQFWAAGGVDVSDTEFFKMPKGSSLPSGMIAADSGRQFYKTGSDDGLYVYDGSDWARVGGTWEGYMDGATNYSYTLASTPIEEVAGQFSFDGSKVANGMKAVFRAIMTPTFSASGTAYCRLYDMGPVGTPTAPRLVSALTRTSSGLAYVSQDLTVVSATPSTNEIMDTPYMYEIVLFMSGTTADTIYLGSAGLNVEFV